MSHRVWNRSVLVIVATAMLWHGAGFVVDHDESEVAPQVHVLRAAPIISTAAASLSPAKGSETPALWAMVPAPIEYGPGSPGASFTGPSDLPTGVFVPLVRSPRAPPFR
jgi:hypothetical protein